MSRRSQMAVWSLAAAAVFTAAAVPASSPTSDTPPKTDPVRVEFLAAMQRVQQHLPDAPDSPALQSFVIYDYLIAARLRRDLPTAGDSLDAAIDEFLHVHAGQQVGRALRHDWLASLAQRNRWDWFLPRSAEVIDAPLICDRLAGRLATGDTAGLARDALVRWILPQKPPDECAPVFAWLRAQGDLTAALADSRTRAALTADQPRLARDFVGDVPQPLASPLLQWIQLLEAPKAALGLLALNPAMPAEADALVAGFNRLSFSDYASAANLLPALLQRADMTPVMRIRLRRAAALGAAFGRAPGAAAAFADLPVDPTDTQVLEWRVRAALWGGDFNTALGWIGELPPALGLLPRWRYWRARALAATAGADAAAPLYAELAGMRDYYGYLAADRLNRPYDLNIRVSPDNPAEQTVLADEPGLIRAHALFDCDLADDAAAEWATVLGGTKPEVKVQAARLASRWGWYAQTIATLAQAGDWDDVPLRYPRPYPQIVALAGKQADLPVDWIYAVMRQESLFRKDAVSRADARGLMQMQPGTATAVARRWHLPPPSRQDLFDPAVAIPLGAVFIRELLDKFHGQLDAALAAYNAGPVSAARWAPAAAIDADIWIENIPYTETRGYVQHILEHIVAFAAMRDATPPRLKSLLPTIGPVIPAEP